MTGLDLDQTYYWAVFSSNSTALTWCEIRRFTTSSAPPLSPVPQTIWTVQGTDKVIRLNYTGGDESAKYSVVTSLPAQGELYQYNAGSRGMRISTVPATVTDASMNLVYAATGGSGNSVGNFNYFVIDALGDSPEGTITVNVSPPGVPNVLYIAKSANVEIQFDITMSDPSGKQDQFIVTADGNPVTISSVSLKEGDPYAILLTLATPLTGTETVLVSYIQGDITASTGGYLFTFSDEPVTLTAQTIDFSQSLDKKYNESPFGITATASSSLGLTYSSSNTSVASFTGSTLTFLSLGTSIITLRQPGNATYAPARYVKTLTVSKGDQTITFNALPVKTVGDADFSPGATASSGLAVSYTSSNSAVATIVGGLIHIIGAGTSSITATQAGNTLYNAATPVARTLTVSSPASKTLSLSAVLLQGLYEGGGLMRQASDEYGPHWAPGVADHITVELHSASVYSTVIYSASNVALNTNGTATVSIPSEYTGSYYITIKHRNSIETTTTSPISFSGSVMNYSFDVPSKVYGDNLLLLDGSGNHYGIYSGDSNSDGSVDILDILAIQNDAFIFEYGYLLTDLNGDASIDVLDLIIAQNNAYLFISAITP
jgi:hypothetical protein